MSFDILSQETHTAMASGNGKFHAEMDDPFVSLLSWKMSGPGSMKILLEPIVSTCGYIVFFRVGDCILAGDIIFRAILCLSSLLYSFYVSTKAEWEFLVTPRKQCYIHT